MRGVQRLAVAAWVQVVLVVAAAGGWVWSAWWHTAAVEAVSDDLVRTGVVDAAAVPAVIDGYPSLGTYLQQGLDRRSLRWGYVLCLVAAGGSMVLAVGATVVAAGGGSNGEAA